MLIALGGGAVTLQVMGPPEARPLTVVQEAPAEVPAAGAAVTAGALRARLPEPLQRFVDPDLVEDSPNGLMPRVAADGRAPMRAYARSFNQAETRPRVALILGGIGLNQALSEQAIETLPLTVALAFSPYAARPVPLLERARQRGFETLLALPTEPAGYPVNDPGNRALLTGLYWAENSQRLDWLLTRFPGHVGAVGALGAMRGERFAALGEPFGLMQERLASRGLLYFDARPGAPNPQRAWGRTADVVIDEPHTRAEIDQRLGQLERVARDRGAALGYLGEVSPVALQRVTEWANGIEFRSAVLAPVTAVMTRPDSAAR
ncbi:divergent polysaccharide deacetylase family protein [Roseococcus sp. YIM B11640]|uniref:divergent polysaccharide deacetylase family protein n=1 Tax=Roseococcus sp. YIM B11640 TaxID=3133973 RepID=UPI003C7A7A8D